MVLSLMLLGSCNDRRYRVNRTMMTHLHAGSTDWRAGYQEQLLESRNHSSVQIQCTCARERQSEALCTRQRVFVYRKRPVKSRILLSRDKKHRGIPQRSRFPSLGFWYPTPRGSQEYHSIGMEHRKTVSDTVLDGRSAKRLRLSVTEAKACSSSKCPLATSSWLFAAVHLCAPIQYT